MIESLYTLLKDPALLEVIFADDIDLLHYLNDLQLEDLITAITSTFAEWGMQIQVAKTEKYKLAKDRSQCQGTKKLGVFVERDDDYKNRILKSWTTFRKYNCLWHANHIPLESKLAVYRACVFPLLTYAIGALPYTKQQLEKLEATHRKQLRFAINIHYPTIVTNTKLYKLTKTRPLRLYIIHQRWRLLGKHLSAQASPLVHQSILDYFAAKPTWKGQLICLPRMFAQDLQSIGLPAFSPTLINQLSILAASKTRWRALISLIQKRAFRQVVSSSSPMDIIYKFCAKTKKRLPSAAAPPFQPRVIFLKKIAAENR
jgi:hypothetical protein